MRAASLVNDTSLTLLHDVVDLLGACRVPALRTVPGLSALSGVLDVDVAFALITLEEMGIVERTPYLDGCLAWRIRNVFNWPALGTPTPTAATPTPRAVGASAARIVRIGGALC